eukprot:Blabericola_migrator_1__3344@NODE_1988_length_3452_cov_6_066470_g1266_i0_p3_GENE_NODE_1988_length_3452_cov_6_066470_g1266_i0NODE_1988_length_3452_cov_6_066470_g1266_i0_p3_ORF_typecomplete_len198_score14_65DUF3889/PF13028_6/0_015_NODE_1988_length_3452_cov_6_066470_g1266_i076669
MIVLALCAGVMLLLAEGKDDEFPIIDPNELLRRWNVNRQQYAEWHKLSTERTNTSYPTLNVSAVDIALHRDQNPPGEEEWAQYWGPISVVLWNQTNPNPITIPVRDIAENVLFNGTNPLPRIWNRERTYDESEMQPFRLTRPLRSICRYQQCTSLGEISRGIGSRLQELYKVSPVGVVQDAVNGAEYATIVSSICRC